MKKYLAECIGTGCLVLFGCGSAVIGSAMDINLVGIAAAFGFTVTAMAYFIGPISGCHINPAVTIGAALAGRMPMSDVPGYIVAQFVGAAIGAALLAFIVSSRVAGYDFGASGLGQNGWGPGYLGEYGVAAAVIVELVATFIFVCVILGVTQSESMAVIAGFIIGLTLFMIHIVFIPVTGVSVNPARSFGPALFAGGGALAQLILFLVVPAIGGALAGLAFKAGIFTKDD
ncbi:MAG: aquaporin [Pseudomonadota bacterium]